MGKIADRLARKSDPLHAPAKEIIQAALAYTQAFDDVAGEVEFDALSEHLEKGLASLAAPEFDRLLHMVHESAAPRHDAEDILDVVNEALEPLCEVLSRGNELHSGYLVAIPMVVEAFGQVAWQTTISPTQADAIVQALKSWDLVVEDSKVTLLPRLLGALEADILLHGEVYRLTRLLAQGRGEEVETLVDVARHRVGMPSVSAPCDPLVGRSSVGVLVAYVACSDPEGFPLATEFDDALAQASGRPAQYADAMMQEAYVDLRGVLVKAGTLMATALGVAGVNLLDVPRDWYSGTAAGRRSEREAQGTMWLQNLADAHTGGDVSQLCIDDKTHPSGTTARFEVGVHRKADGRFLSTLYWVPTSQETAEECYLALGGFLSNNHMEALSEFGHGPLVGLDDEDETAVPAVRVLH